MRFSDGGSEEETQRRAGERGGESHKAEWRDGRLTGDTGPTEVRNSQHVIGLFKCM